MTDSSFRSREYWEKEARRVLDERSAKIGMYLGSITVDVTEDRAKDIYKMGVADIRKLILNEELTVSQVLAIFYKRSLNVGVELCALADVNIEYNLKRAEELEEQLKATKKEERESKLGPLFGVPISIKDNLALEGTFSTLGITSLAKERLKESGIYCKLVIKHGGIPFVKTNVPMFLKTTETVNWIYGRTCNPWDVERTPGGSSGGESALISSLCSPAGLGGDIGGSIRCPSSYTGIYGFKPTSSRTTNTSSYFMTETKKWTGLKIINGATGPMARNVDDLVTLFKVMVDPECQQSDLLSYWSPWNERLFTLKRRFRIGYIESCKEFEASKASVRAVRQAVDIGRELGHDMIDMNHVDISSAFYIAVRGITAGSFVKSAFKLLRGERNIPEYDQLFLKEKVPHFIAKLFTWWANKNPSRFFKVMEASDNSTTKRLINSSKLVEEYKRYFEKITLDHKIDAWILPVNCLPALKHTHAAQMLFGIVYTVLFNMLDYPAGAIPMTFVREDEQTYESAIDDRATRLCKETMKGSAGLPIGVQIACPTGRDELTLNLMKQFEEKIAKVEYPYDINFKK